MLKEGSLYYLNGKSLQNKQINSASHQTKENQSHWKLGHMGERSISTLKKDGLGFDFDGLKKPMWVVHKQEKPPKQRPL